MCVGWISEVNPVRAAFVGLTKAWWESAVPFANAREGWQIWEEKLSQLDAPADQILIGMEATSCYHENLYHELEQRGYILRLLHPRQTHQFHERQGLRAKTARLDAMTIAKVLLSGEARAGYVPSEQVVTYRELVRLHTRLSDEAAAYQNEIQALVVVLFPEFTRIFADPCGQTALAVLKAFPGAQAIVAADVEPLFQLLRARDPSTLWPSDSPEAGGFRQRECEQWASTRRTIAQSARSLRSVRAYPSESGTFGC
jgi:transposase